jgi:hypothetical protein
LLNSKGLSTEIFVIEAVGTSLETKWADKLQIIAPARAEDILLRVGAAIEDALGLSARRPRILHRYVARQNAGVETTGFNGKIWLGEFGHPLSPSMHLTERYSRRDFDVRRSEILHAAIHAH